MKMNVIAVAVAAAMLSLSAAAQDKKPMDDKGKIPQTSAPAPDTKPGDAATGSTAKAKKPGKPGEVDKEKEKKQ